MGRILGVVDCSVINSFYKHLLDSSRSGLHLWRSFPSERIALFAPF